MMDFHEVEALVAFAAERREYERLWALRAEGVLLDHQVAEAEVRAGRIEAGQRYADMLGLAPELAPVVAVAILSHSREVRLRAGAVIARALLRALSRAA